MSEKRTLENNTVLVTGAAGFIGSNLVLEMLKSYTSIQIIGVDNVNDYYDVSIKEWRLKEIEKEIADHPDSSWTFVKGSIADKTLIDKIFEEHKPDIVVNLAAQAGVRYSITNPMLILNPTSLVFITFWKLAVIRMIMGKRELNI